MLAELAGLAWGSDATAGLLEGVGSLAEAGVLGFGSAEGELLAECAGGSIRDT